MPAPTPPADADAPSLRDKRILLIVGGGIAAYKTLDLTRQLRQAGASVRVILTRAAEEFVTPLALGTLSGEKVYRHLFDLTDEAEIGHIQLSRQADLLIVAPATAHLMARMAQGLCDDLATTVLLATDKPVLMAPAMNVRMWEHPATLRNRSTLEADGIVNVGPNEGDMACGEYGPGRMAEPFEIVAAAARLLAGRPAVQGPLTGRRALVTAGPTHEPIDPVRYVANRSSGRQGYAIARALAALGAETVLVSGPTALPDPAGVTTVRVETAREMLAAAEAALPADIGVFTAAVADWRPATEAGAKIKKRPGAAPPALPFAENPDILAAVAGRREGRPRLVVGFAAETGHPVDAAKEKLLRKGCDWVVANDVSPGTGIMGGERNAVHIVRRDGVEHWPDAAKEEVAARLAAAIAEAVTRDAPGTPDAAAGDRR